MRYHIAVKFLAVALCAACLLTAVGSGLGILAMTTSDLYEKSVSDVYSEALESLSDAFAGQIATKYASQTLGGCPEGILEYYGKIFNSGYYGYRLTDADGNVLEQMDVPASTEARYFSIPITGRSYQKLISVTPESELNAPTEETIYVELFVIDNIPGNDAWVDELFFYTNDGFSCSYADEALGVLYHTANGDVYFQSHDPDIRLPSDEPVTQASFFSHGKLLYEIVCSDGVGAFSVDENGLLSAVFRQPEAAENTIQENTAPATEVPAVAATEMPTEAPAEPATEPVTQEIPTAITDNTEQLGTGVAVLTIFDENNYTFGYDRDQAFGKLTRNADGTVTFRSYQSLDIPEHPEKFNRIAFLNAEGWLLYEVQSPKGVGEFTRDNNGCLIFTTTVTPEDVAAAAEPEPAEEVPAAAAAEAPTEVPTEAVAPDTANIIAEVTEPPTAVETPDIFTTHYWDSELQEYVQVRYTYEDLPEGYTLELWLLPGAFEMDPVYDLLELAWQYRNELFYLLGASTLLFAVFAVYLCCAAGRKPGRAEILPGGFNCLPLDVYLAGGATAICALVILTVEGGYYLLRNSPHVIAHYVLIAGYLAALIIVSFCFACAAQFKTPGGYWWKNTLCARFVRLILRVGTWLERLLGTMLLPFLGRVVKFCWRNGIRAFLALFRCTEKFLTWFVEFSCRAAKFLWKHGSRLAVLGYRRSETALTWLGRSLKKIARKAYVWIHSFLSLLPVTWQWLLIGLVLLFVLFLSILTRSEGWAAMGCLAGIALVVYGSHCFGILWESTRNMSKGNLETKVDDKLMVGAFKDFAADLNALADVAVVAAQKQLKSERMKTELITNVSHDIKTPLTSIINYVDLLQKPHTDEEQEAYLEVLSRQSLRMKKLLEDLMEMSKASTGNMSVNITSINASEAVTQALGEFSDKLEKARLTPMVQQPEEPLYLQADGRLVWRVLSNLLSNVVKYALPGTRVYVDILELEDSVLISLKNISREALNVSADELIERFVRGDASRNTEGSGLGLNIAQSLMEIQKGKLELIVDGDLFKVTLRFPKSEA